MKKCTKCGEIKEENKFNRDKNRKNGLQWCCKQCEKEYRTTFDGLITKIYSSQKRNSKRRGHKPPSYTKNELIEWTKKEDKFLKLFNEWHKTECPSGNNSIIPSIDRLDNNIGYSIENIRWTTSFENNKLGNEYKKKKGNPKISGKNNPKSNTKDYYIEKQTTRGNFKTTCKRQGWKFEEFEEVYSGEKLGAHKKYYYKFKKKD